MGNVVLSTKEFETVNGQDPDIALATGIIYAIAFEGPDNDIWVKTVSVSSAGVISSVLDSLEIHTNNGDTPRIIQIADGFCAIVFRGDSTDGYVSTVSIDGSGNLAFVDEWVFDSTRGTQPFIIKISSTIYAVSYDRTPNGRVKTFAISATGVITKSTIASLTYDTLAGTDSQIIHISGDIWAIVHRGTLNTGYIRTVDIDSSGNIAGAVVSSFQFADGAANDARWPSLIHIAGTKYAMSWSDIQGTDTTELLTIDIQNDGTIAGAVTDSGQIAANGGWITNIGLWDTNVFLITHQTVITGGNLTAITIAITDAGVIGAIDDTLVIAFSRGFRQLATAVSKIWVLVSEDVSSDGRAYTVGVAADPTVSTQSVTSITDTTAAGNGTISSLGTSAVTAHGMVWDTSPIDITLAPTAQPNFTDEGAASIGAFQSSITGLTLDDKIYARAYATNSEGSGYGQGVSWQSGQSWSVQKGGTIGVKGEELHYVGLSGTEYALKGEAVT